MKIDLLKAVEIEINHACNMACFYCPNSLEERVEKGHMAPDVYQKILQELQSIHFKGRLSYSFYNEPLLSSQLEDYVSQAKHLLPEVTIELYTNGTKLTTGRYRSLREKGVDLFIVTKHADVGSDYEFEKTYAELSAEEKKHVRYQGYKDINLTNRGGVLKDIGDSKKTTFMPCLLPTQMLTITVKGTVVPCFEDFRQKNQMGNLMEHSLLEIWNSPAYSEFREGLQKGLRHKFEACKDCNRWQVL